MILKRLLDALNKTASEESVKYLDGAPTVNANKNFVHTSQSDIFTTKESEVKKQMNGLKDTIPTFLNTKRQIQTCFDCGKLHMMDVLYDPNDKFVCPTCERKDDNETSI